MVSAFDKWSRRLEDAEPWRSARSLEEIGELVAQWLEGHLLYQPAYLAPGPAAETSGLIPVLAAINRKGLVTRNSQPGRALQDGYGQRAWVTGFCTQKTLWQLEDLVLPTELVLIASPPLAGWSIGVPITIVGGRANTHGCQRLDLQGIQFLYGADLPAGVAALSESWQVDLIDPSWGRDSLLWQVLSTWSDTT
jgi:hypothetical protein